MISLRLIINNHIRDNSAIIAGKRAAGVPKSEYWDWICVNAELEEILDEFDTQEAHRQ